MYWPEDTHEAVLTSDVQIDYWFKFTVGMPAELLAQIFAECARIGYVQHVWLFGLVARVAAAEVLVKHTVHGSESVL